MAKLQNTTEDRRNLTMPDDRVFGFDPGQTIDVGDLDGLDLPDWLVLVSDDHATDPPEAFDLEDHEDDA